MSPEQASLLSVITAKYHQLTTLPKSEQSDPGRIRVESKRYQTLVQEIRTLADQFKAITS